MIEAPVPYALNAEPACGDESLEDLLRECGIGPVGEGFAVVVRGEADEVVD